MREHLADVPGVRGRRTPSWPGIPGLLDLAVVTGRDRRRAAPARDRGAPAGPLRARAQRAAGARAAGGRGSRSAFVSALAGAAIAVAAADLRARTSSSDGGRPGSQYRLAFEPIGPAPAQRQRARRAADHQAGTVVRLWVNNLPGGPATSTRSSATRRAGARARARSASTPQGNAYVILTTAVKKGQYDKIRIVRREHLADGEIESYDILGAKLVLNRGRGERIPWYETDCSARGHGRARLRRLRRG